MSIDVADKFMMMAERAFKERDEALAALASARKALEEAVNLVLDDTGYTLDTLGKETRDQLTALFAH